MQVTNSNQSAVYKDVVNKNIGALQKIKDGIDNGTITQKEASRLMTMYGDILKDEGEMMKDGLSQSDCDRLEKSFKNLDTATTEEIKDTEVTTDSDSSAVASGYVEYHLSQQQRILKNGVGDELSCREMKSIQNTFGNRAKAMGVAMKDGKVTDQEKDDSGKGPGGNSINYMGEYSLDIANDDSFSDIYKFLHNGDRFNPDLK
jgi:hypothetical protein